METQPHQQPGVVLWSSSQEVSREFISRAKHVNTCSDDFGAPARVDIRALLLFHIRRGRLCEHNGLKNMFVCALEVEILNVHVFAHKRSPVH
jgi:hypothetical protein